MQTHDDFSHDQRRIIEALQSRALDMLAKKQSQITSGFDGEEVKGEEIHNGICCRKMPDDPEGVTRISVGSHPEVDRSAYCVIRGERLRAIELLRRAVRALERSEF